jgi:hypothetical protein
VNSKIRIFSHVLYTREHKSEKGRSFYKRVKLIAQQHQFYTVQGNCLSDIGVIIGQKKVRRLGNMARIREVRNTQKSLTGT